MLQVEYLGVVAWLQCPSYMLLLLHSQGVLLPQMPRACFNLMHDAITQHAQIPQFVPLLCCVLWLACVVLQ
jgi:hypothetical protein